MRWIDVRDYLETVRNTNRNEVVSCFIDGVQSWRLPCGRTTHDVTYIVNRGITFRYSIFANCAVYLPTVKGIGTHHDGKRYYLKEVNSNNRIVWTANSKNAQVFATIEQGKQLLSNCKRDNRNVTFCIFTT